MICISNKSVGFILDIQLTEMKVLQPVVTYMKAHCSLRQVWKMAIILSQEQYVLWIADLNQLPV